MNPMDHELHQRWLHDHDSDAFTALVREHAAMVYATCRRVLGNAAEAEDVAQECFWKFAREARPIRSIPAWLHTVATRLAINRIRSEGRRRTREERFGENAAATTDRAWSEVAPLVDEALAKLPENQRELIVLHYFEGRTHAEIAEREGIVPSTVTRRIQRAVEELRNHLTATGISAAALGAGLTSEAQAAVPPTLHVALVKIGLANGETAGTLVGASSAFGWLHGAAIALIVALAGTAGWFTLRSTSNDTMPVESLGADQPLEQITGLQSGEEPEVTNSNALVETESASPQTAVSQSLASITLEDENSGAVFGTVLNHRGNPLPGATVTATVGEFAGPISIFASSASGTTNHHGQYRLENLPGNALLKLTASTPGYQDNAVEHVPLNGREDTVSFTLDPGIDFFGRVLTLSDQPIPNAQVVLIGYDFDGIGRGSIGVIHRTVSTDADGRFRLGLRGVGHVVLKVVTPDQEWNVFPWLRAGGRSETVLRMPEYAELHGTIFRASKEPATNVEVHLDGYFEMDTGPVNSRPVRGLAYSNSFPTDRFGKYQASDLPHTLTYEVRIVEPGEGSVKIRALSEAHTLDPLQASKSERWDYVFRSGMEVSGRVVAAESGRAVEDVPVAYRASKEKDHEVLDTRNGNYRLRVYSPNSYFVFPMIPAYTKNENESLGIWIPWNTEGPIERDIMVPEPFTMRCRILDVQGEPLVGIKTFVVFGRDGSSSRFKLRVSNHDGEIEYTNAFPHHGISYWFETLLTTGQEIKTMTTPIVGEPGAEYPVETIVLRRAGGFAAKLRETNSNVPIKHARVDIEVIAGADGSISDGPRTGVRVTGETDAAGFYSVASELPEGTLDLRITAQARSGSKYQREVQGVQIAPGLITTIETVELYPVESQ